jgi:hypothetical protein
MVDYRRLGGLKPKQLIVRDSPAVAKTVEWMLPQIAERSKVALEVLPSPFWQYNQVRSRKCSCFVGQSDPDANCNACFGTGFLPGYTPVGYYSYICMDVTDPGLMLVNVEPNYTSGQNPTPLELQATALTGYIETPFQAAGPNLGSFSSVMIASSSFGVEIHYSLDGIEWKDLQNDKYDSDLATATKVKFRVLLTRESLKADIPFFQVLHARLQVQSYPLINLDVPRWVANLNSTDAGLIPLLETFNAFADKDAKIEQTTVWIQELSHRKFKVLTLTPNMPGGVMTSWDMTMRLIQDDESLARLI